MRETSRGLAKQRCAHTREGRTTRACAMHALFHRRVTTRGRAISGPLAFNPTHAHAPTHARTHALARPARKRGGKKKKKNHNRDVPEFSFISLRFPRDVTSMDRRGRSAFAYARARANAHAARTHAPSTHMHTYAVTYTHRVN